VVKSNKLKAVLQENKGMDRWMLYSRVERSLQKLLQQRNKAEGGRRKKI